MAALESWLAELKILFSVPLFSLGRGEITILTLIYLLVFSALLFYLSGRLRHWIVEDLLTRTRLDLGARQSVGSVRPRTGAGAASSCSALIT